MENGTNNVSVPALSHSDRERLYEIYTEIEERLGEIACIMRAGANRHDWERARAYWFGSLSIGLNSSEYCTHNPTFKDYLEAEGIMNPETGEFIPADDEDEVEDEGPVYGVYGELGEFIPHDPE